MPHKPPAGTPIPSEAVLGGGALCGGGVVRGREGGLTTGIGPMKETQTAPSRLWPWGGHICRPGSGPPSRPAPWPQASAASRTVRRESLLRRLLARGVFVTAAQTDRDTHRTPGDGRSLRPRFQASGTSLILPK